MKLLEKIFGFFSELKETRRQIEIARIEVVSGINRVPKREVSMNDKDEKILKAVNNALGFHVKYFDIEKSETLDDDEDVYSMTVMISPKDNGSLADYDSKVVGEKQYLQFELNDTGVSLMTGADCEYELDVTLENIYSQLYWGEVIKAME